MPSLGRSVLQEGLPLLPWLFWGAWVHMEKHCSAPSFLGKTQSFWVSQS